MLTMFQRAENYVLQNAIGGRSKPYRLTASQQRRIRQGERKALPTGGKVHRKPLRVGFSGDYSAFLKTVPLRHTPHEPPEMADIDARREALTEAVNACPRCKATGENSCVTPAGKATKTHKGRGE